MAQNLDPQDIEAIVDGLRTLGTAARESGNSVRGAIDSSIGQSKKLDEASKLAKDKFVGNLNRASSSLTGFGNQLQTGAGSFAALNSVLAVTVGKIPVLGDAAMELVKTFDRSYGIFEQLADTGVLQTFEDLKRVSDETGMNFADVSKVLGKFSKELGAYGGTVIAGREEFEKIAYDSRVMRSDFQKLGISVGEFNDLQLTYISQQQKWGLMGNKNTKDLVSGTETYIKELDTLTKLTGLQKKDIQTMRDQAMSETRFAAAMAQLPESVQKSANDLNVVLKSAGAESIAQGLRDMMSGSVGTDAAKQFVQQTGGMGVEIVQRIRNGTLGAIDGFNEIKKAAGTVIGPMGQLAQHVGDASLYTKSYAELRNLVNRKEITPQEMDAILKKRKESFEATEGQNAELARTKQRLYELGSDLERLMTSSENATWAIDKLTDTMYSSIKLLLPIMGIDMTSELKARMEVSDAIQAENKARKKVKQLEKNEKDIKLPNAAEKERNRKRIADLQTEVDYLEKEKKKVKEQEKAAEKSGDKMALEKARTDIAEYEKLIRQLDIEKAELISKNNGGQLKTQAAEVARDQRKRAEEDLAAATAARKESEKKAAAAREQLLRDREKSKPTTGPAELSDVLKRTGIGQTNPNSSSATAGKGYIPGTGKYEGLNIKSTEVYGGTTKGGADTDEMLLAKIKEFAKQFPGTRITAFNDLHERETLKHRQGKAVDFTLDPAPKTEQEADQIVKLLGDMGFTGKNREEYFKKSKNWTNPHFHAEMMAKGGITKGISIAGERGPEAVVPLPDGRTIPVEIKNQRYSNVGNLDNFEIQNLANTFKETMAELKRQQETTNARLADLIQESKVNNQHISNVNETLMASKRIQGNLLTHTMS